MAKDPGIGNKIVATIKSVKGDCNAGHEKGDTFEISCFDSGGLCGFFYHDIYPTLSTLQFGGKFPWCHGNVIELRCPDRSNLVTMLLETFERK